MPVRWPYFDLVLRTPHLELRVPDDLLLEQLADVSLGMIHPPEQMPFMVPWTDAAPIDRGMGTMQWAWRGRAELSPERWRLGFAVVHEGVVIGLQDLGADGFVTRREVNTGSYLAMAHQGRGFGKEMRAAVLSLAFDHLGAEWAISGSHVDNLSSSGVSRALGYEQDGIEVHAPRGVPVLTTRWRMNSSQWAERRPGISVTVEGVGPCLRQLGLGVGDGVGGATGN